MPQVEIGKCGTMELLLIDGCSIIRTSLLVIRDRNLHESNDGVWSSMNGAKTDREEPWAKEACRAKYIMKTTVYIPASAELWPPGFSY